MSYQYDNQGRITEKTKRINGMPDVITTYEYDEKGLVEREKKDLKKELQSTISKEMLLKKHIIMKQVILFFVNNINLMNRDGEGS